MIGSRDITYAPGLESDSHALPIRRMYRDRGPGIGARGLGTGALDFGSLADAHGESGSPGSGTLPPEALVLPLLAGIASCGGPRG